MNLIYFPVANMSVGLAMSAALWQFMRGGAYAGEDTQYCYPLIIDQHGNYWAYVDLNSVWTIPPGSTGAYLLTVVAAGITAGQLSLTDTLFTQNAITASQGNTVALSTLLLPDSVSQGLTVSQMFSAGNL